MRIFRHYEEVAGELAGSAVAIGNFDGLHLGHGAIIETVKRLARKAGGPAVVFTFRPHPAKILRPQLAPSLITTYQQKLDLIESHGIDAVIEPRFDRELAGMAPSVFARTVLVGSIECKHVAVGENFRFGAGAAGDPRFLANQLWSDGVETIVVTPRKVGEAVASSSRIRELIAQGEVAAAAVVLGRPHRLTGTVIDGFQRGRKLGFPTANFVPEQEIRPASGVYACLAVGSFGRVPAVVNIGWRPTFGDAEWGGEAHLLDFTGDLYGQPFAVDLVERIRPEQRFPGPAELARQIQQDIEQARLILDR